MARIDALALASSVLNCGGAGAAALDVEPLDD
jgi:hypothetical protein